MKILITGSNGLLGQKIVQNLLNSTTNFIGTSKGANRNTNCPKNNYQSLDITNPQQIKAVFNQFNPDVVINTAAMTNVDACEMDELNCRKINVDAVRYLFNACKKSKAKFIQLSTDFVFDGQDGPYTEEDARNPLCVYAKSKVDAEDFLLESNYSNWAILRTIIVFGEGVNLSRSNIVLWAKDALSKGNELTIVNDQFRAPTWADDLAWACIKAAISDAKGVFHISGPETFSIFELVNRVANFYGYDPSIIKPISSSTLNQKAVRPPKTGFIIDKAKQQLNYNPLTFEQSLAKLKNRV